MKCSDYDKVSNCLLSFKGYVGYLNSKFYEFDYLYDFKIIQETIEAIKQLDIVLDNDISRFKEMYKRGE